MMLIFFFFSSGGKILVQLLIKNKFPTDVNEVSQLKMAIQLPLNEISQPKLNEKELAVVIISKTISTIALSTLLLTTQTLKEPNTL
jgi:hypothetical protein